MKEKLYAALARLVDVISDALKEWLKPRTIFAAAFYAAFLYMLLEKLEIPPVLNSTVSTLFGYWFGSRQTKQGGTNG